MRLNCQNWSILTFDVRRPFFVHIFSHSYSCRWLYCALNRCMKQLRSFFQTFHSFNVFRWRFALPNNPKQKLSSIAVVDVQNAFAVAETQTYDVCEERKSQHWIHCNWPINAWHAMLPIAAYLGIVWIEYLIRTRLISLVCYKIDIPLLLWQWQTNE